MATLKGEIYSKHLEAQGWKKNNSLLWDVGKVAIQNFYNKNRKHLDKIMQELTLLEKEVFEFEGDHIKVTTDEKGNRQFHYNKGWSPEKHKESYVSLLNQPI